MTTFPCKTEGCDGVAASRYGRYAYCPGCRERKASEPAGPPTAPPGVSFEKSARELVTAGRNVDRALRRYRPAKAGAESALRDWKRTLAKLAEVKL